MRSWLLGHPVKKFSEKNEEKLLNPQELAQVLNVRPGTVYSWLSRGIDIPHVKIAGTVRFREKAVMDSQKGTREKKEKL